MSFPFVEEAVKNRGLVLQGAYFSIIKARLMMSDNQGDFHLINDSAKDDFIADD